MTGVRVAGRVSARRYCCRNRLRLWFLLPVSGSRPRWCRDGWLLVLFWAPTPAYGAHRSTVNGGFRSPGPVWGCCSPGPWSKLRVLVVTDGGSSTPRPHGTVPAPPAWEILRGRGAHTRATPAVMRCREQSGPGVAVHTPVGPGLNVPGSARGRTRKGRSVPVAGASGRAHAWTVGPNAAPLGSAVGSPLPWRMRGSAVGCSAARAQQPGVKGWTAHPEAPGTTHHYPRNERCVGVAPRGLRGAPAGLRSTLRRTPPTRHQSMNRPTPGPAPQRSPGPNPHQ